MPEKKLDDDGQEEMLEEIYDLSPCGFFTALPDGLIIKVNEAFLNMTGYSRTEILTECKWTDLLMVGSKIYHQTHLAALLKIQGNVKEISLDFRCKNGSKIPVLLNSVKAQDPIRKTEVFHFSILDVTQRKHYEQELLYAKRKADDLVEKLKATNTELEQFAYIVSHDLQSPLAAIKGYIEIIQMKNQEGMDESTKEYFKRCLLSADRMSTMIKDLLDYSKLETNSRDFELIDLNEIWDFVCTTFHHIIAENKALLDIPVLPFVRGNKSQLTRLFQNLLSNSLKYRSEKDPEVKIIYNQEKGFWKFRFIDNGLGFSSEHADKIFNIFHRLDGNRGVSGTGIGLAATKKIVEKHGGEIWAESSPGKGATFIFTLPVIEAV